MSRIWQRHILLLIVLFAIKASPQTWKTYPYQPQGSIISFPEDEGFHFDEPVEWLYVNGHITGKNTGDEYSFMLSYFYYPAYGYDGFRIFSLENKTSGQFYDESLPCIYETAAEDSLNLLAEVGFMTVHTEEWVTLVDSTGRMIPFQYHINASSQFGSVDINCNTLKRPLIIADSGYLYQGNTNYTYYYSQTMIEISGILNFNSVEDTVFGTGWIDHQYGSFNPNDVEEYEWFCIQLDNGMDLNIWNIFTDDNKIPDTSTYRICSIYVNDSSSFTTSDFNIERLRYEYTRDSLRCYSQQWNLLSDTFDIDLLIATQNSGSEVELPFRFFEGSTVINGTVKGLQVEGKGFAELLHSYVKPDFTIINPGNNDHWNENESVRWKLNNPDEGNPVKYNIEISYDNKNLIVKIAQALEDTSYYWNPSYFTEDTAVSLMLTAYSVDSTLIKTSEVTAIVNPQTKDYELCPGDSISFVISLKSKGQYNYQWQKNGTGIPGATDSIYTLRHTKAEDDGGYRCIINNNLFTDTTITFDLHIMPVFEINDYKSICESDSIYIGGGWQNSDGIYYDSLSSVFGCDSVVTTTLSVEICNLNIDESLTENIKVLPNPATKSVYIEFDYYFKGNIEIINYYGEILHTEVINNSKRAILDLSGLTNGMYVLRFRNNESYSTVKILIIN